MSIAFVFGAAGSGKSTLVQDMIIKESMENPRDNYLLIVPDQFTMQTQMDIVKRHPKKGILNIDVLSFGRLSYRVFSVTGKSDMPVLDDTGKSLVLRRVASQVSKDMPYMGHNLNKVGFIHEVKSSISEFMQYNLSYKDVEKLSSRVSSNLLKSKLNDLGVIYKAFCDFNKDKFITSEETLDILCKKLPAADFIKGSTIVFDGFTGFTPIQENVVLELSKLAKKVIITFDLSNPEKPSDLGGEEKLFYLSRKGARRLKTKAADMGIAVDEDIFTEGGTNSRFSHNPEFAHIEKNLFRYPVKKYPGTPENVVLFACKDMESEVSQVALKIHELIRSGEYTYRDIAVVTGNLESYGNLFQSRMRELDMPVFIDKTNGIVLNPFTEYLKSAMEMVIKDFSYDSVFHYLRSGFTNFTEDETDRFDRYVTSLNIRGKSTYLKPFTKREKGLKDKALAESEIPVFEDIRKRLMEEMSVLLRGGKTAGEYASNLYEFLKDNDSYGKLLQYEDMFTRENDLPKAKEYGQIYKCIMELLDTIVSLLGDEEMEFEEFYRIFEAGISEIEVGTIPRNVDRIVVGDIERTRISQVKALFLCGVNDGNIPKDSDKGGILSGVDREELTKSGYELAPTPREQMYTQRLYLYMNLCKPTDKLFVSYAGTDSEGKGMRPSYLIDVIRGMFEKTEVSIIDVKPEVSNLVTLKDSARYYAALLRDYVAGSLDKDGEELIKVLYKAYKEDNFEGGEKIMDAAFIRYVASPLSAEIVRMIYTSTIQASISRMELYAGCAYAYFLKYGMKLLKNEEYGFEARDLGTIYHGVLDCFSQRLEKSGLLWTEFTKEQGREMIKKAVEDYCENYEQGLLSDDEQTAYTVNKITKIMERTVDTLQFQLSRGRFLPKRFEYRFEREIPLSDDAKLLLNGQIDRVDLYEEDGKVYVKILDYKSGERDIDVTNVYHGIEQQLAFYMAEAVYHEKKINPEKTVIPSALLYYAISNPMISVKSEISDEALEAEIRKELKLNGLVDADIENISLLDENACGDASVLPISFNKDGSPSSKSAKKALSAEEMQNLLDYVESMVKNIGIRINSGDIKVSPMRTKTNDACKYCDYKSICRFDSKIQGYKKRDGKEITEERAREVVLGGDKDGIYTFT